MTDQELFDTRVALVRAYLQTANHDAVLLNRADNFAMATGGKRNFVPRFTDMGAAGLLVTRDGKTYVVGNNIEEPRLRDDELLDWVDDYCSFPWHDGAPADAIASLCSGDVVSDDGSLAPNVNGELAVLRALLTPRELEKYRIMGRRAAEAMTAAATQVTRGMLEADVAALLHAEAARQHLGLSVCLVAADDRITRYRHPLPTMPGLFGDSATKVNRYVMLVGGFVRDGLVVSMTRFVAVDDMADETRDALDRIAAVDTLLLNATAPGATLGDCFEAARAAYPRCGFHADEWRNHHQGGATGYAGRTSKALPGNPFPCLNRDYSARLAHLHGAAVPLGTAFAWNPSAPGVKSEDTILLLPDGRRECVTDTPLFPAADVKRHLDEGAELRKAGPLRV